jgi:hypothetical protein
LHGVRRAVLPSGLPAGQSDPGLERSRLQGRVARRDRSAARHERLPGVHRTDLPGAVRGGLRAGDQRRCRGDQVDRRWRSSNEHSRKVDRASCDGAAERSPCGGRGVRASGSRGRRAAEPPRARSVRVRARRGARRPHAVWRARLQARQADHRPPRRAARARGGTGALRRRGRCRRGRCRTGGGGRRRRAGDGRAGGARAAAARARPGRRAPRDGLPVRAQPLGGLAAGEPDQRRGPSRRCDRRWRHGDGLRRQRPPRAGGQRHDVRQLHAPRRDQDARDRALARRSQAAGIDLRPRRGRRSPLALHRPRARRRRPRRTGRRGPAPAQLPSTGLSAARRPPSPPTSC